MMRMRIVAVVAGATLVLPAAALAQEDDLCHFDPTNPECILADDGEDDGVDGADDGVDGADDGVDGADDGIDGVDDGVDGADGADDGDDGIIGGDDGVDGEVPTDELAVTGTEVGSALGIVAALLALGGLLVLGARRRGTHEG